METRFTVFCLAIALLLFSTGVASSRTRGAFENHLRDAIRLNQARLPLYSELTEGESEAISKSLIRNERLGVPVAIVVDRVARYWQKRGVPVVAEDFVDLSFTPEFVSSIPDPQPLSEFQKQDGREIASRLRKALEDGGFSGVHESARAELARLESAPTYHAMLRHVLESTLRAAHLAPKHEALARSLGLKSPAKLSRRLIKLNLLGLDFAAGLDARAAPIQAQGIPIIHRDVPPIGTASEFYDSRP